tara:strand:- start:4390 stop:4890 length:501 start_codon:yes stop_codon:yes gene_type:complete
MKKLKLFMFMAFIAFSSCSKEDNSETTPTTLEVKTTVDLTVLENLTGNDATALISFYGTPADQYTTDALIGDKITYTIETNDATIFVRLTGYEYSFGSEDLWGNLENVNVGGFLVGLEVKQGAVIDQETKFNIYFQLEKNGVLQTQKTYFVDPKIRIRSKRPSSAR